MFCGIDCFGPTAEEVVGSIDSSARKARSDNWTGVV